MKLYWRGDILDNENYNVREIIKELKLEEIYEAVRIIDPIKKKIFNLKNDMYEEDIKNCFSFWPNNSICSNCVSMRAFKEDKVCTKIQKSLDKTYLTISKPVNVDHRRFVIEMIKDVSNVLSEYNVNEQEYYKNTNDEIVRDTTTDAFNRRFLDERIGTDILTAKDENKKLTILLANVDNLKCINKKYGHVTGDAILAEIANEIDDLLGSDANWVARYGGDEFFICLNNINKDEAYIIAEKMRVNIEKRVFTYGKETFNVTVSLGIAEICNEINSFEELMDDADKNLQIAKNNGKNRVVIHGDLFSKTTDI